MITIRKTDVQRKIAQLYRIQKLIESTHWTKGTYNIRKNRKELMCLMGMVRKVSALQDYDMGLTWDLATSITDAARARCGILGDAVDTNPHGSIVSFNDHIGTTRRHALQLVARTIKRLEKQLAKMED